MITIQLQLKLLFLHLIVLLRHLRLRFGTELVVCGLWKRSLNRNIFFSKDDEASDKQAHVDASEDEYITWQTGEVSCSEVLCGIIVEPCGSVA